DSLFRRADLPFISTPSLDFPLGALGTPRTVGVIAPHQLAIGDFNRDGIPDLAYLEPDTGRLAILLGLRDGTFGPPLEYEAGSPRQPPQPIHTPYAIVAADFNHDGILDLAVAEGDGNEGLDVPDPLSNRVLVFQGNGDGTFGPLQTYAVGVDPRYLV